MEIYCKNYNCGNCKKLLQPINFKFRKHHYNAFDNPCEGKCSSSPYFHSFDEVDHCIRYEGAECNSEGDPAVHPEGSHKCSAKECLHWNDSKCTRDEILIDKVNEKWVCRCFSQKKIRGHMDWSRFPIGGSVDDSYADKLARDKNTQRF